MGTQYLVVLFRNRSKTDRLTPPSSPSAPPRRRCGIPRRSGTPRPIRRPSPFAVAPCVCNGPSRRVHAAPTSGWRTSPWAPTWSSLLGSTTRRSRHSVRKELSHGSLVESGVTITLCLTDPLFRTLHSRSTIPSVTARVRGARGGLLLQCVRTPVSLRTAPNVSC